MNKSDNTKSVTIHRRVKSVSSVDRSQIKRPASKVTVNKTTSSNKAKAMPTKAAPAKSTPAKSSDTSVAVKIKKPSPVTSTATRSKMISHFSNTAPAQTSIGVKIVKDTPRTSSSKTTSMRPATSARTSKSSDVEPVVMHPMLRTARARMQERRMMMAAPSTQTQPTLSARELKDIAIRKALASTERTTAKEEVKPHKLHFSFGRILIALGCTAAAVFAIAYFINLNISDFSLYAAAKQAGIESANKEPRVPQEYSISNISSENGKIEINYKNNQTNESMTITEEKSSWDSNALLTNYVRNTYLGNFATIREQGLTIYISESNACWVNGGIVYKITAPSGSLDKKQIRQIATSL